MQRAAIERHRSERELRKQMRHRPESQVRTAPGYFRKLHALDCGVPRCGVCHRHKRFGHEATRQEVAAALKLREQ